MNDNMAPNQSIQCGVCSCSYHDPGNYCSLSKIHVDPMPGGSGGAPEDESMCGSYRCRGKA